MTSASLLLVDDEQSFVEILTQRLLKRGFAVTYALSGRGALSCLEEDESIEVVVLDVKMPGMDGLDTIKMLKQTRPLVQVIMLTGHATVKSAIEAMKFGAFDYLMKPCDLDELIDKVNEAAKRKRNYENQILEARTKPYISDRERDKMIAKILDSAKKTETCDNGRTT
jgi:DNA-binding NtrC family response regulator